MCEKARICPNCGKEYFEDDKFCHYCGAKLNNTFHLRNDTFAILYGPKPILDHVTDSDGKAKPLPIKPGFLNNNGEFGKEISFSSGVLFPLMQDLLKTDRKADDRGDE